MPPRRTRQRKNTRPTPVSNKDNSDDRHETSATPASNIVDSDERQDISATPADNDDSSEKHDSSNNNSDELQKTSPAPGSIDDNSENTIATPACDNDNSDKRQNTSTPPASNIENSDEYQNTGTTPASNNDDSETSALAVAQHVRGALLEKHEGDPERALHALFKIMGGIPANLLAQVTVKLRAETEELRMESELAQAIEGLKADLDTVKAELDGFKAEQEIASSTHKRVKSRLRKEVKAQKDLVAAERDEKEERVREIGELKTQLKKARAATKSHADVIFVQGGFPTVLVVTEDCSLQSLLESYATSTEQEPDSLTLLASYPTRRREFVDPYDITIAPVEYVAHSGPWTSVDKANIPPGQTRSAAVRLRRTRCSRFRAR